MSWSIGFDRNWNRDIGYGVPAHCDHPNCNKAIDRGLAHVCGDAPYGGEHGCGLYFCEGHHRGDNRTCERCEAGEKPFKPKPEHLEWLHFKATDESWAKWRNEQPEGIQQTEQSTTVSPEVIAMNKFADMI